MSRAVSRDQKTEDRGQKTDSTNNGREAAD